MVREVIHILEIHLLLIDVCSLLIKNRYLTKKDSTS
nr:MAG TPA: hypothetical protein [Caudoviricetes sp.]